MPASLTVGVDIGGTKVLAGTVDPAGRVHDRVRAATPHSSTHPRVVEDTIVDAVNTLRRRQAGAHRGMDPNGDPGFESGADGAAVLAVGVGAAGFVDVTGERELFAPHLSWRDEPLRDRLAARLGLPVLVDNDANATAFAELSFGAARGRRQVLCVTLGTGIGGALVIDGRVFRGAHGLAGEFGHLQVVPGGRLCECGNRGCWEQYSSGNVLVREARDLVATGSPSALRLAELVDGDPAAMTGHVVTRAAQEGDPTAAELLRDVGTWLGTGLANLAAAFDPELVVVGGGVAAAGDLLLDPAREALGRSLPGRGFRPEPQVVPALLGASAGMVGAAHLARTALPGPMSEGPI